MEIIKLTYTEFTNQVLKNSNLIYHHIKTEKNDDIFYELFSHNGDVKKFVCYLNYRNNSVEIDDYVLNYESNANKSELNRSTEGITIFAPTLDDVQGLYPKKKMYKHLVTANSISIFDNIVENEKRICGGEYWIYDEDVDLITENCYVEFSIVDKTDVLGLFQHYGLSVANGDVLELTKFIINDYIRKGNKLDGWHSILFEGIKGTNILYPNLHMRVTIYTESISNFRFLWRCYYYE